MDGVNQMQRENAQIINKTIKKSAINAEGLYDYKKLEYENEKLLPCVITEDKETLEAAYDITDCAPFTQVRKCNRPDKLRILLDVAGLLKLRKEYSFSVVPENLYFDKNYRVFVMDRDIYGRGEAAGEDFLETYKALVGYALQNRYSYENYIEGGMDLLKKHKFLKEIYGMETLTEITAYLAAEYEAIVTDIQENKMMVSKTAYGSRLVYIVISMILLLAGAGYIGYYSFWERPILTAKLQAEIDFLKGDYIQVIDDLTTVNMEQLAYDQKYILSTSYVRTENLTVEQKENILEKLPVNGDEKMMEYWIYIGRMNPLEAENIAMQKSDDELLLYAYMLEKNLTEADTELTGEEKASKLADLTGKIEKLAEKYVAEEEQH